VVLAVVIGFANKLVSVGVVCLMTVVVVLVSFVFDVLGAGMALLVLAVLG